MLSLSNEASMTVLIYGITNIPYLPEGSTLYGFPTNTFGNDDYISPSKARGGLRGGFINYVIPVEAGIRSTAVTYTSHM